MPHKDNLLLASLSPGDLAALQPHLKLVNFDQEQVLFEAGDTIVQIARTTDSDGNTWMVATHKAEPTPAEMKKAMAEMMKAQAAAATNAS